MLRPLACPAGASRTLQRSIVRAPCPLARAKGRGVLDRARLLPAPASASSAALRHRRTSCSAASVGGAGDGGDDGLPQKPQQQQPSVVPSSSEPSPAAAASASALTSAAASKAASAAAAAAAQPPPPTTAAAATAARAPLARSAAAARAALGRAYDALTRAKWYGWYLDKLEKQPSLTKAATAFCGFVIGDLVAQSLSGGGGGGGAGAVVGAGGVGAASLVSSSPLAALVNLPLAVDWARTARMGAFGLLIDGPLGGAYYSWLDRTVFPDDPLSTRTVLTKTLLDQTLYSSLGTVVFFAFIRLLETGGDVSAVGPTLASKFWPTLRANWVVWPLAHLINFRYVPPPLRVAYNQVVAVGWLTWLSLLAHSRAATAPAVAALAHKAAAAGGVGAAAAAAAAAAGAASSSPASAGAAGGVGGWLAGAAQSVLGALPHF